MKKRLTRSKKHSFASDLFRIRLSGKSTSRTNNQLFQSSKNPDFIRNWILSLPWSDLKIRVCSNISYKFVRKFSSSCAKAKSKFVITANHIWSLPCVDLPLFFSTCSFEVDKKLFVKIADTANRQCGAGINFVFLWFVYRFVVLRLHSSDCFVTYRCWLQRDSLNLNQQMSKRKINTLSGRREVDGCSGASLHVVYPC